ncbi:hypothetical protein C8R43DRAFT_853521, partial [Mycena crocata]
DFNKLFSQKGFDLMRPKGGSKYPGVSKDVVDRSSLDDVENIPAATGTAKGPTPSVADILGFDGAAALAAENAEAERLGSESHSVWIKLDGADDGKKVHKKSILRSLMDPTFDIDRGKSHDRLLRI